MQQRAILALLFGGICFACGFFVADKLNRHERQPSTYRPEVVHADGSVEVKRVPGAKPTLPAPKHPKHSRPASTTEVTIQPLPANIPERRIGDVICPAVKADCPPVKLRLDLVEENGQEVVTAKAQDGRIIDAIHIPRADPLLPLKKRITVIRGARGDTVVTFQKDFGRWSVAAGGWEVDGNKGAGLGGSFAW